VPNYWYSFRYGVNCTFFDIIHASQEYCKKLKLRDPSGGLVPMPKLAYERKVCSMHKILSLSFYI
jgi:hypothetical protein